VRPESFWGTKEIIRPKFSFVKKKEGIESRLAFLIYFLAKQKEKGKLNFPLFLNPLFIFLHSPQNKYTGLVVVILFVINALWNMLWYLYGKSEKNIFNI
jgi:hypothetical protein